MGRIVPLRFVSGVGVGILVGWGLGASGVAPSGGWPQWVVVTAGLSLALVPAFLLSRQVKSSPQSGPASG